jgi:dipeptidyl aminopeptidase/acylaminoacyl peptidase
LFLCRKPFLSVVLLLSAFAAAAFAQNQPTLLPKTTQFSMERFLNVRNASGPSISPKGDEVVYLTNVSGVNQVWKNQVVGGYPEQLTFFDDRVHEVHWSPRGDVILFTKDQGGNERTQLYLMDPNGETIEALTNDPKVINNFGDFSRDGSKICYSSNARMERYFDVYVMDLATRQPKQLLADNHNYYCLGFSPDGRYVLANQEHNNYNNDLFLVPTDPEMKGIIKLTPHQGDALYTSPAWLPDGSGFYLASNQDRDKMNLAFYDFKIQPTNKLKFIEDSPQEIDEETGISMDRGGKYLFYGWNDNGSSSVRIRNLQTNKVDIFRGLPKGVVGNGSFSADGSRVAFDYNSPAINDDVWSLDLKSNRAAQVTHSTRAGIPADTFVQPQTITYPTFDGRQIPAFLYLPKNAAKDAKLAAIVMVHGGPEGQERADFSSVLQYFVNRGYAVLAPNVRGSTGYGREYTHADDYKKRMDAVKDVAFAHDYLKNSGYIDPKKIVVMGGSYGGFMTLAEVTMNPDLWAAGVDIVGIANWATFFKNTGAWRRENRAAEYGDPEKDPEFMKSISPINYVNQIKAPLFVIAGANDPRVPAAEAEQIVAAVKAKGIPVESITFPDEGHGMAKRANRIKGYGAIADFLDKYIK